MAAYENHKLADIFPEASPEEFQNLVNSIRENGLRHPITLYEGKILDGRHRYRACIETGTNPRFVEYEGDNPTGFVVDENVHRRHLNRSQVAMAAADCVTHHIRRGQARLYSGKNKSQG